MTSMRHRALRPGDGVRGDACHAGFPASAPVYGTSRIGAALLGGYAFSWGFMALGLSGLARERGAQVPSRASACACAAVTMGMRWKMIERQQVLVSRDDQAGLGCHGAGQHGIVVRIAADGHGQRRPCASCARTADAPSCWPMRGCWPP
ncbi:hypothetical protein [Ottowia sp.]|uniref:hypothetical protein n=1 Tax=Ottowia sp. TaxID=1898956 RepID=UPI0039E52CBE